MKRIIGSFVLLLFLFLLQTALFNRLSFPGVRPNAIIVLVVAVGYRYGKIPGVLMGFFVGLLLDFTEGTYLGYYALMYLLIGYIVGFCNKIYHNDFNIIPLILVTLSDFVLNMMQFTTGFLLRNRLDLPYYFIRIILPEMVFTGVVSVLLYKLVDMVYIFLEKEKKKEVEET